MADWLIPLGSGVAALAAVGVAIGAVIRRRGQDEAPEIPEALIADFSTRRKGRKLALSLIEQLPEETSLFHWPAWIQDRQEAEEVADQQDASVLVYGQLEGKTFRSGMVIRYPCPPRRGLLLPSHLALPEMTAAQPEELPSLVAGVLLVTRGHYQEALNHFAFLERPAAFVHLWRALLLDLTGQANQAAEAYRQAAAINPDAPEVFFNWGRLLQEQGHAKEAFEKLSKARHLQPDLTDTYLLMGRLLEEAGHREKAIAVLRAAEGDPEKIARCLEKAGNLSSVLGDWQGAIQDYRRALQFNPDLDLFPLAQAHLALGLDNEGKALLLQALERHPDDPRLSLHLARLATKHQEWLEACHYFRAAQAHVSREDLGWWALSAEEAGELEEAIALYKRIEGQDKKVASLEGKYFMKSGRWQAAMETFEKILADDPRSPQGLSGLGNVLVSLKRAEDAIRFLRRAIALNPRDGEAWLRWGQALVQLGHFERAYPKLQEAARLVPNHPELLPALRQVENQLQPVKLSPVDTEALRALEEGYGALTGDRPDAILNRV